MKSYIVINSSIYSKYKEDILPLNARLFCDENFYNLDSYNVPLDLKGIENYLIFIDEIEVYTTSTFIDFVNILLILDFLKTKEYKGKVKVNYVMFNSNKLKDSILVNTTLTNNEYDNVADFLLSLKNKEEIKNFNIKLPGSINYINFYNMLVDSDKFIMTLQDVIDECDEDIDEVTDYLFDNYSNMGLSKEFYLEYLKKYM
ncbi:MAG: hypothetical protein IJZ77_02320 [Bacilli bacterium]|nr:hypothetical protein [Bacilli bacterium]